MDNNKDINNNENKAKVENEKIEALIPEANGEKKNNALLFVIIGFLVVVILVFVGLIATGALVYNNNKEEIKDDETVEKVEDKEFKVTEDLKKDLGLKVDKILTLVRTINSEQTMNYVDYGFNYAVFFRDLTDTEKQQITLKTLEFSNIDQSRYQEVPYVKNTVATMVGNGGNRLKDNFGYLTYDEVNKAYRNLFGEDLENPVETVGKCPTFYYSKDTNEFYHMAAGCGGTSGPASVVSYKEKYVGINDTIELYMNFGFVRLDDMNSKEATVYGNLDSLIREDGLFSYASVDKEVGKVAINSMNEYKITEENKDIFTQYKFTFRKDKDNYYFEKVEKVR